MNHDGRSFVVERSELDHCTSQLEDPEATCTSAIDNSSIEPESKSTDHCEKHSAVWTTSSTSILLKLYEAKLEMLETPKKKTRIWIAITENLKHYDIEMTPDQVRWKINALTKKYKHCIDTGQCDKFKYFKEMDAIYAQYNVDCDSYTITGLQKKNISSGQHSMRDDSHTIPNKSKRESKSMIELRKLRLASRIESDRCQSKINLERQWLEYLTRQESQKILRDEIYEKTLKLRAEELKLRKQELEMKESVELKKLEIKEREQNELLKIEREKCDMLRQLLANRQN